MRVTIIGAGGFRTPLTYRALLDARDRLGVTEVVLHDSDPARLSTIEAVLAGIDAEQGRSLRRRAATDLDDAVRGPGQGTLDQVRRVMEALARLEPAYVVLDTYSGHRSMPEEQRRRLYERVRRRIGDRTVRKTYLFILNVAAQA